MTKQVLLSISGLQFLDEGMSEPVEVVTAGEYYNRNGKHWVIYEEVIEGIKGSIQNTIKIGDHTVEVTKKGLTNVHMVFEESKKNMTSYSTPFGNMFIGILASDVDIKESENDIDVKVAYSLEVNYEHLADCTINMNIKSKDATDFTLHPVAQ